MLVARAGAGVGAGVGAVAGDRLVLFCPQESLLPRVLHVPGHPRVVVLLSPHPRRIEGHPSWKPLSSPVSLPVDGGLVELRCSTPQSHLSPWAPFAFKLEPSSLLPLRLPGCPSPAAGALWLFSSHRAFTHACAPSPPWPVALLDTGLGPRPPASFL